MRLETGLMSKTARQLLKEKDHTIQSIGPDATVYEAVVHMAKLNKGALLVLEGDHLCGIVSERDYTRKIILQDRSSRETQVREIMSKRVVYVVPDTSAENCLAVMSSNRVRHLPVVEDEVPIGMLSIIDVVEHLLSEKEFIIRQLEQYISGG